MKYKLLIIILILIQVSCNEINIPFSNVKYSFTDKYYYSENIDIIGRKFISYSFLNNDTIYFKYFFEKDGAYVIKKNIRKKDLPIVELYDMKTNKKIKSQYLVNNEVYYEIEYQNGNLSNVSLNPKLEFKDNNYFLKFEKLPEIVKQKNFYLSHIIFDPYSSSIFDTIKEGKSEYHIPIGIFENDSTIISIMFEINPERNLKINDFHLIENKSIYKLN